jgi:hypothetical protein
MEPIRLARISSISGKLNFRTLPISVEVYALGMQARRKGALIQDAFPMLSAEDREFLLSGITPEEWNETFGHGDGDAMEEGF